MLQSHSTRQCHSWRATLAVGTAESCLPPRHMHLCEHAAVLWLLQDEGRPECDSKFSNVTLICQLLALVDDIMLITEIIASSVYKFEASVLLRAYSKLQMTPKQAQPIYELEQSKLIGSPSTEKIQQHINQATLNHIHTNMYCVHQQYCCVWLINYRILKFNEDWISCLAWILWNIHAMNGEQIAVLSNRELLHTTTTILSSP